MLAAPGDVILIDELEMNNLKFHEPLDLRKYLPSGWT